jgi:hypothetical protein
MTLQEDDIEDHISLDKVNNTISFTYANIDNCVDQFLNDWERIFMMINLSRQGKSLFFQASLQLMVKFISPFGLVYQVWRSADVPANQSTKITIYLC